MRWIDLAFFHWPLAPEAVRPLIPDGLELETFEDRAWIGVVPFTMEDVAPRGLPAVPRFSRFPEVNVRTYVRHGERSGVWFLSLDARSWLTVLGGRAVFHLPYHHARMRSRRDDTGFIDYQSRRSDEDVRFAARYRADGPPARAPEGSFDHWSTERRRLFSVDRRGRIWRTEIDHAPWPLQPAVGTSAAEDIVRAAGLPPPGDAVPVIRFVRRLDVRGWAPVPVAR